MSVSAPLAAIRAQHPLLHCISNIVSANDCANLALAIGASPIMAQAPEEMTRRDDENEEKPKSLLYAIAMDAYPLGFSGTAGESLEQQVHLAIFKTIRNIAAEGPCVIIGRCADYALAEDPNLLSLFISAPLEDRIARVAKRQKVTPEEAKSLIQKTDKRRASYCEYYASKKWGAVDGYDFCLNSSSLGLGGTVELIRSMVDQKEHPIPSPTEIDPTQTEA